MRESTGGDPARPTNRWLAAGVPRGDDYDRRFDVLAASGADVHAEARLVASYDPRHVLDAGCGTGRVAIELARRGCEVTGLDLDPVMLATARRKAPALTWIEADLAHVALGQRFDVVVLAGNVLPFVEPGTEAAIVARAAAHVERGGRLIAGWTLRPGVMDLGAYDRECTMAGLVLENRWATWDRTAIGPDPVYAVSVHHRPGGAGSATGGEGTAGAGTFAGSA